MGKLFNGNNNEIKKSWLHLIGKDEDFTTEHQFLNGSILFIGLIYFITVVINYLSELSFIVTIINSIVTVIFAILYYFSRFKKYHSSVFFIFYVAIFSSLTIDWYFAGGLISSMPYYYLAFICFIIFFSKGTYRLILVTIYLINIIFLFAIEYYHPEYVTPYPSRKVQFEDMAESYFLMVVLIIYMVNSAKRLYLKEKRNSIDIIEQYRKNNKQLRKEYANKINLLSIREQEIFQLIISGKTNQEIANALFISVGTVKQHINKIYKKLETKGRRETISFASNHN